MTVFDRPETSLGVLADLVAKRDAATSEVERAAIQREMAEKGGGVATRMFAGKDYDGAATLTLSDAEGRARLRLSVGRNGTPVIQFLDADGRAVREIVP